MATELSIQKITDGFQTARFIVTGAFDDSGAEDTAVQLDGEDLIAPAELKDADPHGLGDEPINDEIVYTVSIESVRWSCQNAGQLTILQHDGEDPVPVLYLSDSGSLAGGRLAPTGGAITISSAGFEPFETFTLEVIVRKKAGFVLNPVAMSAAVLDETTFFTGDTMAIAVEFDKPVNVVPHPVIQVAFGVDEGAHVAEAAFVEKDGTDLIFALPITDAEFGELTEVWLLGLLLRGAAKITGGFSEGPARLTGFVSDLDEIEVNPNRILSAVFSNAPAIITEGEGVGELLHPNSSDHNWNEGDTITLTVTFGQPVNVVFDDMSEIGIVGDNLDNGELAFEYAGGAGTRTLLFRAVIPADDVVQTNPGTFDLVSGVNLAGEDAIISALTDSTPVGVADQDWSEFVNVAQISINDVSDPEVAAVTFSDDHSGAYVTEDVIQVTVTFSEPVVVIGVPKLSITLASGVIVLPKVSAAGPNVVFSHTVTAENQADATEFVLATDGLALDGGEIKDLNGLDAVLTLANIQAHVAFTVNPEI